MFPTENEGMLGIGGAFDVHGAQEVIGAQSASAASGSQAAKGSQDYTTIMLRNIPNKYTRAMMVNQLDSQGFKGKYDYLYLPTDFTNRCNVGYCFINFRTSEVRQMFNEAFDGVAAQVCLPGFNSYKVCNVTRAKWQGRDDNVRRIRNSGLLMAQLQSQPEWLPLLFDENGGPMAFPDGVQSAVVQVSNVHPKAKASKNKKSAAGAQDVLGVFPAQMGVPGGANKSMLELQQLLDGKGGAPQKNNSKSGAAAKKKGKKPLGTTSATASYAGLYGSPTDEMTSQVQQQQLLGGMGAPIMVPVQGEHGVQYVPYDPYNHGAYLMAYMPQAMYGMPVQGYPGFAQAWGMEEEPVATPAAAGKTSKKRTKKSKELSTDLGTELQMPEMPEDEGDGGMQSWDQSAVWGAQIAGAGPAWVWPGYGAESADYGAE